MARTIVGAAKEIACLKDNKAGHESDEAHEFLRLVAPASPGVREDDHLKFDAANNGQIVEGVYEFARTSWVADQGPLDR